MATLRKGLFGPFSGKLGGVVGSTWNGIQVVKKLPARRKNGSTPAQLEQQARFTQLVNFLKPITPVLNKAFEKSSLRMTGFNKALSDNKNAVTGIYPDFTMDYTKVMLCKGMIRNEGVINVSANPQGKLIFSVSNSSLYSIRQFWTLFFIAAYEEESRGWIYVMNPVLTDDKTYELEPGPFRSKSIHTFAGFMPSAGASTVSMYTGMITI